MMSLLDAYPDKGYGVGEYLYALAEGLRYDMDEDQQATDQRHR